MSRSLKKGPFTDEPPAKKVAAMNDKNEKKVLRTWSRRSTILPEFIGHTLAVHNGRKFIPVYVTENMVGRTKLGEFFADPPIQRTFSESGSRPKYGENSEAIVDGEVSFLVFLPPTTPQPSTERSGRKPKRDTSPSTMASLVSPYLGRRAGFH